MSVICPIITKKLEPSSNLNLFLKNKELHLFTEATPKVFCKKSVFRNFTKFTGKHLCLNRLVYVKTCKSKK